MKRIWIIVALFFGMSASTFALDGRRARLEFSVSGGLARVGSIRGGVGYSDRWGYKYLEYVQEDTSISLMAKNSAFALAGLTFFFTPNFGVEVGAAYAMPKVSTNGSYNFSYKWTTGSDVFNESAAANRTPWGGSGKAGSVPVFLNLVGRYRIGPLDIYATAGPAAFFSRFEANSFVGFGDTSYFSLVVWPYLYEYQYVDAFRIPVRIPKKTWTAFGGNFGAGLDLRLARGFALMVEGRYFLIPAKSFSWEWTPGTYDSIFYDYFFGWQYTADDLKDFQAKMGASRVNLSFFSVAIGVKIGFGGM